MDDYFPVLLVSPDGGLYEAKSPAELNSLIYGHGYKAKDPDALEKALSATEGPRWAESSSSPTKNPKKTVGD